MKVHGRVANPAKVCFMDRDGVLNVDTGYACDPSQISLVAGIQELILVLLRFGYEIIVVSNQSGLARGYFSLSELHQFQTELFSRLGFEPLAVYICPHHPQGIVPEYRLECLCRKPYPGLIQEALQDYPGIDVQKSFLIGDSLRDCEAASIMGLKSFFLDSDAASLPPGSARVMNLSQIREILLRTQGKIE